MACDGVVNGNAVDNKAPSSPSKCARNRWRTESARRGITAATHFAGEIRRSRSLSAAKDSQSMELPEMTQPPPCLVLLDLDDAREQFELLV